MKLALCTKFYLTFAKSYILMLQECIKNYISVNKKLHVATHKKHSAWLLVPLAMLIMYLIINILKF